jgi:uncharacterized protein YbjT (DUF2867 family)
MNVAIIGGTGFVGSYIVQALERDGHAVSLLVRPGSEAKIPPGEHYRRVAGDVSSPDALDAALSDCDAVVYCVGILRAFPRQGVTFEALQYEGVVRTVESAIRCRVDRFLLMSANGVKVPGTPYQETKKRAEEAVFGSGLDATVFRPSVIFGDPDGRMEFATQLCRDMVRPPLPAVGFFAGISPARGSVNMSPVHVEDVARAFAVSLTNDETVGEVYELGGPEVLTWTDMIRRIADAVGRRKWILPMPIGLMKIAAALLDWLPAFPVTRDQLSMLEEGNVAGSDELEKLTGRRATPFEPANLAYLRD